MSGIPFVEELLSTVINNGIKYLQSNPNIVDSLFAGTTLVNRERLKQYLASTPPTVVRGWPVNTAKVPVFVILLSNEDEAVQSLGNFLGESVTFTVASQTETLPILSQDGAHFVQATKKPLVDVTQIKYLGATYDYGFEILDENRGLIEISFDGVPDTETVDVTYDYYTQGNDSYGSFFQSQFRIETWTNNGDLTVLLYNVLKWILLSSRNQLLEAGLPIQKLSGVELEPLPDYLPEFTWRRGITLTCEVENSYDVPFDFIQGMELTLNLEEPNKN